MPEADVVSGIFFYGIENSSEISYAIKNAPRGCGQMQTCPICFLNIKKQIKILKIYYIDINKNVYFYHKIM